MSFTNFIIYFYVLKITYAFSPILTSPWNTIQTGRNEHLVPQTKCQHLTHSHLHQSLNSRQDVNDDEFRRDIAKMERDVMKSTRERLDRKTVENALIGFDDSRENSAMTSASGEDGFGVPAAAGAFSSFVAFSLFHSLTVSAAAFLFVFIVACGDPMNEQGFMGQYFYVSFT